MVLRVKEVLEEPTPQDADGALRQSALRPPGFLLHHSHLTEGLLLPQALVEHPEPGGVSLGDPRAARTFSVA